jgi:plasmid stability protein
MPSLTLKDIPMPLMERLRSRAAKDRRSLNREAIWLLEQALEPSGDPALYLRQERDAQLGAWKALAGRWQGSNEETDELVEDIYRTRTLGRDVVL